MGKYHVEILYGLVKDVTRKCSKKSTYIVTLYIYLSVVVTTLGLGLGLGLLGLLGLLQC